MAVEVILYNHYRHSYANELLRLFFTALNTQGQTCMDDGNVIAQQARAGDGKRSDEPYLSVASNTGIINKILKHQTISFAATINFRKRGVDIGARGYGTNLYHHGHYDEHFFFALLSCTRQ